MAHPPLTLHLPVDHPLTPLLRDALRGMLRSSGLPLHVIDTGDAVRVFRPPEIPDDLVELDTIDAPPHVALSSHGPLEPDVLDIAGRLGETLWCQPLDGSRARVWCRPTLIDALTRNLERRVLHHGLDSALALPGAYELRWTDAGMTTRSAVQRRGLGHVRELARVVWSDDGVALYRPARALTCRPHQLATRLGHLYDDTPLLTPVARRARLWPHPLTPTALITEHHLIPMLNFTLDAQDSLP